MALATKCPHCNTTFRVAHDQLKLRGGIVRCGACNEVFDGNAALVDPAPRTPVIIDLPEVHHDTAPALAGGAPAAALSGLAPHDAAAGTGTGADAAPPAPAGAAAFPGAAMAAQAVWRARTGSGEETGLEPVPEGGSTPQAVAAHIPAPELPGEAAREPAQAFLADAAHGPAPGLPPEAAHEAGIGPVRESAPAAEDRAAHAPGLAHGLAPSPVLEQGLVSTAAPDPDHDFDLDLNGDEPPATSAPATAAAMAPAATTAPAPDDAFDLDFDIDGEHATPAPTSPWDDPAADTLEPAAPLQDLPAGAADEPATDAATDSRHFDGRREPTLDIPDEHLAAVALHDSFELDAYPHAREQDIHSTDEHSHTLETGAWRSRDGLHHLGDEAEPALEPAAPPAADADTRPAAAPVAGQDEDGDDDIVTLSSAAAAGAAGAAALAPEPSAPATPVSARPPEEPGFVKRSRRRERWGKASRIAMACALPLLLAGLAYQAVATFRNSLAAAVPALKPALVSACALAGCKVELPAQLDALSIEQGELQTMADNIFSFSTSLRNQSPSAQSWPHIELILNDGADKPVLRRVFAPRDYLPPGADLTSGFLPRSEQPVKLYFELSRVKASGYHIAVFYP